MKWNCSHKWKWISGLCVRNIECENIVNNWRVKRIKLCDSTEINRTQVFHQFPFMQFCCGFHRPYYTISFNEFLVHEFLFFRRIHHNTAPYLTLSLSFSLIRSQRMCIPPSDVFVCVCVCGSNAGGIGDPLSASNWFLFHNSHRRHESFTLTS